jgi:hypothetical protein
MIGPICTGVNKCGWRGTVIESSPLKWGVIHNFEQPSTAGAAGTTVNELRGTQAEAAALL